MLPQVLQRDPRGANNRFPGNPNLVSGVIDSVFDEDDIWDIVDYKTDDIQAANSQEATEYYRPQLDTYTHHWTSFAGLSVRETGIYFIRLATNVAV